MSDKNSFKQNCLASTFWGHIEEFAQNEPNSMLFYENELKNSKILNLTPRFLKPGVFAIKHNQALVEWAPCAHELKCVEELSADIALVVCSKPDGLLVAWVMGLKEPENPSKGHLNSALIHLDGALAGLKRLWSQPETVWTPKLDQMRAELGTQAFQSYFSFLMQNLPPLVASTSKCLENSSWQDLKRAAHSLKSNFAQLGWEKFSLLCQAIEDLCETIVAQKSEDFQPKFQVSQLVSKLHCAFDESYKKLQIHAAEINILSLGAVD